MFRVPDENVSVVSERRNEPESIPSRRSASSPDDAPSLPEVQTVPDAPSNV
ncbi:hypothetical protein D3C84_1307780 [compost metagenome]